MCACVLCEKVDCPGVTHVRACGLYREVYQAVYQDLGGADALLFYRRHFNVEQAEELCHNFTERCLRVAKDQVKQRTNHAHPIDTLAVYRESGSQWGQNRKVVLSELYKNMLKMSDFAAWNSAGEDLHLAQNGTLFQLFMHRGQRIEQECVASGQPLPWTVPASLPPSAHTYQPQPALQGPQDGPSGVLLPAEAFNTQGHQSQPEAPSSNPPNGVHDRGGPQAGPSNTSASRQPSNRDSTLPVSTSKRAWDYLFSSCREPLSQEVLAAQVVLVSPGLAVRDLGRQQLLELLEEKYRCETRDFLTGLASNAKVKKSVLLSCYSQLAGKSGDKFNKTELADQIALMCMQSVTGLTR